MNEYYICQNQSTQDDFIAETALALHKDPIVSFLIATIKEDIDLPVGECIVVVHVERRLCRFGTWFSYHVGDLRLTTW